jgi:hypothetical protein
MPGKPPGAIVLGIIATIKEHGPSTTSEIRRHLGRGKNEVGSVVSRMSKAQKLVPKRLRVVGYVYDDEGSKLSYPRAVYDLGDGPDAPPPGAKRKKVRQRYWSRKRGRVASVFDLGVPFRERRKPKDRNGEPHQPTSN